MDAFLRTMLTPVRLCAMAGYECGVHAQGGPSLQAGGMMAFAARVQIAAVAVPPDEATGVGSVVGPRAVCGLATHDSRAALGGLQSGMKEGWGSRVGTAPGPGHSLSHENRAEMVLGRTTVAAAVPTLLCASSWNRGCVC